MAIIQTTIAGIRSMTSPLGTDRYYVSDIEKEGFWLFDPLDTTSADNTGTILKDTSGNVYKRIDEGIIDLKWFGVTGSGNESIIIQTAINVCAYKTLWIPEGVYYAKNLTGISNLTISGPGTLKSDSTAVVPDTLLAFTDCTNVTIRDITLDGNKGVVPGAPEYGVALLRFFSSTQCEVSSVTFQNNAYLAVSTHSSPGLIFTNNYIYDTDSAFTLWTDCENTVISSNRIENGTSDGIVVWGYITDNLAEYSTNITIVNNTIHNKTGWGILLRYGSDCTIQGNTISNTRFGIGSTHLSGQPVPTAKSSSYIGNTVSDCYYGIYGYMHNCTVIGNSLNRITIPAIMIVGSRDTPSSPSKNVIIAENVISNSSYIPQGTSTVTKSILLENAQDCVVVNNTVNNDGTALDAGIVLVNALTVRNRIEDNLFKGTQPTQGVLITNSAATNTIAGENGKIVDNGLNNIYKNGLAIAADVVTVNASNEAKLPANGDFFKIAGAAVTINRINTVTGVHYGRIINIVFTIPNCIVNRLVGNIGIITPTYISTTNSILTLVWNGTAWIEISRSSYNTVVVNVVVTGSVSKSLLNTTYPAAKTGFTVSLPNLTSGAVAAIKQDDSITGDWQLMPSTLAV